MLSNLSEIIVSLAFIILLALKLDPPHLLMPNRIQMSILALLAAAAGLYAGILFRQRARDEREALHLYRASRFAFIAGVALLVLAIAVQSFRGGADPWLFYILGGMVVVKLVILIWSRIRN
jgi:uncharacterized membrane protein YgdD (TMEM256/DUF423 family)